MIEGTVTAGWGLLLRRPSVVLWATGSVAAFALAALAGDETGRSAGGAYYLLTLVLFEGVLGGEPSRSVRRWLGPDTWSAGRLLLAGYLPRAVLAAAGLSIAFVVFGLSGGGFGQPENLLRGLAVLLASSAEATLLSAFVGGWFNVVGLLLVQGMTIWWTTVERPEAVSWLASVLCPPLVGHFESSVVEIVWPLLIAAVALGLTWWHLRRSEVPR